MDYQQIIDKTYSLVSKEADFGEVARYIPELSKINPSQFGVHLTTIENKEFGVGDNLQRFSIQSFAKVFSLTLAYRLLGEKIWKRLGSSVQFPVMGRVKY